MDFSSNKIPETQSDELNFLTKLGFNTNPHHEVFDKIEDSIQDYR